MPDGEAMIFHGTCHLMLAMEVGLSIELDRAGAAVHGAGRARLPAQRNPGGFDWSSPPLTLEQDGPAITVEGLALLPSVQLRVFDFGAVSLEYRLPFSGHASLLTRLAMALSGHADLLADARARVQALCQAMGDAIRKPALSEFTEDYLAIAVRRIDGLAEPVSIGAIGEATIAGILRAESGPLSEQEVRDSVAGAVSYGVSDITVVDWNAALIVDAAPEACLDVLEFANVELLEYRTLDAQLDGALAEAYGTVTARRGAKGLRRGHRDLERLAELQMDAALLYEELNNALKLLGDQFLARLYRAANRRMHLDEWERSTLRKLETLESIYEKLADEQAHRRAELLEWIIIALITAEIIFSLVTFLRH
jgi:hypothetical protein